MKGIRYFIQVGNCFVDFIGWCHDKRMRADYTKAAMYLTKEEAEAEAKQYHVKGYKIVEKEI